MLRQENATWWQGDREIFPGDVAYIRTFVKRFPGLSRTELTCTLCEHLDWLTPAGRPKFEACSKLLARMQEAGELRLPSLQKDKSHPGPRSCAPRGASARTDPAAPFDRSLSEMDPVGLRLTSDRREERLWNDYVDRYHPLGYKKPFGYWERYFIDSGEHRLGCILLGGAAKALRARERWIGWNDRAAGWALLGRTSGDGLVRRGKQYQTSPKLIFAKALQTDFRALLCSNQLKGTTEL